MLDCVWLWNAFPGLRFPSEKFASGQTKNHKSTLKSGGRGGNVSHIVLLSTCQGAHDAFHFHLRTCFWHLCANAFFFKHFWGNFTMMPKAREAERAREAEGPKGQRSEGSKDPRGRPKRPRARNAERARRARGVQRPEGSKGPRGRRAQYPNLRTFVPENVRFSFQQQSKNNLEQDT